MELNSVTTSSLYSNLDLKNQVGITVLKKAQDADAQMALQLLQAIPSVPNLPSHLGQNINIVA